MQHGKRRAEEMREAAVTVREAGFEPWIAAATADKQAWVAALARSGLFHELDDTEWREYADRILRALRAKTGSDRAPRRQSRDNVARGAAPARSRFPSYMNTSIARPRDLDLTRAEFALLRRLDSPAKIQEFVSSLRSNFEIGGQTCLSVREVLKQRRAHCIEGAMLAACALWVHGEPPLLLDLQADRDYDHVVALFRRNGCWGAISKTNRRYCAGATRCIGPCASSRCPTCMSTRTGVATRRCAAIRDRLICAGSIPRSGSRTEKTAGTSPRRWTTCRIIR